MPSESGRYKICVVGPAEGGKSTIANVLADATEVASEQYRPTVGCRILEFESEVRGSQRITVELWDLSGDPKGTKYWPACKGDTVGVVLVYNPEKQDHEQEVEQWYSWFPRSMNMNPASQVMVVQSCRRSDQLRRWQLPGKLAQVGVGQPAAVSPEDLPSVRKQFSAFLENVRQAVLDKQRQEEEDVMKAQG
eukprot:TRINITY_DN16588_c0_g1_i1.p1 TRINITY_DN16588_c0_g1~~TRINITY_DN16588_c0_g1_i1.p1  ORF type:complete len:192 (+),score=47.83 TRINITY_DN16588_c0_g1_i1:64-639(+)